MFTLTSPHLILEQREPYGSISLNFNVSNGLSRPEHELNPVKSLVYFPRYPTRIWGLLLNLAHLVSLLYAHMRGEKVVYVIFPESSIVAPALALANAASLAPH